MSAKLQQAIQSLFESVTSKLRDKSEENGRTEEEDAKPPLLAGLERIVFTIKHWDPFPLRAHNVEDVNEVNKRLLLAVISFLLCTSFALVWISTFIIDARRNHDYSPTDSFSSHVLSLSAIVLVISLVGFAFSLCGFIGVFRENIILIRVFYIALIVILSFKLTIALFILSFTGAAEHMVGSLLGDKLITNYRTSSDIEATMDYLQIKFRCCGLREQGFQDWNISIYFNCSANNPSTERCGVPWSCCRNETDSGNALCGANVQKVDRNIASKTIYTKGCIIAILEWASGHAFLVGFLLLLETLLLTGMIFQCTHLVNELQMMNGVYRGPWWIWVGETSPTRRQHAARGVGYRRERPMAALPFHLELIWHEPSTSDAQWQPETEDRGGRQQAEVSEIGQMEDESIFSGQQTMARYEQRRSTIGQRFFRAVISRASRLVHRRQAVINEEEEEEEEPEHTAAAPQQQGRTSWVVHHHAREVGSVGPTAAASRRLEPLRAERETESAGVPKIQRSPLPPIGERAMSPIGERVIIHMASSDVQEDTEVEPVQPIAPVQKQSPNQAEEELFEKRAKSIAPDVSSASNKKQPKDSKDSETGNVTLPGLIEPQTPINLPVVRPIIPRQFSATVQPDGSLAASKGQSKTQVGRKISRVLDTADDVNVDEPPSLEGSEAPKVGRLPREPITNTAREKDTTAAVQPVVAAPTGTSPAKTDGIPQRPLVPVAPEVSPPATAIRSSQTEAAAAVAAAASGHETPLDVQPSRTDDDDAGHRKVDAEPVQPEETDEDTARPEETYDDTAHTDTAPAEIPSAGPMDESTSDQEHQLDVPETSTDAYSEKKDRKSHHRKSRSHKRKKHKKKKGHVSPMRAEEEAGPSELPDDKPEPIPKWLMPIPQKSADAQADGIGAGSVHFSPSEFQHLAVSQKQDPAAGTSPSPLSQRRGTIATAISKKLHEILPSFNPTPTSPTPQPLSVENDEHISVARTVSRRLHDILPSFGFHSGGPEPKPAAPKGTPGSLLSPGVQGQDGRTPSPASPSNVDSDADW